MSKQLEALAAKITAMGTAERLRFAADLVDNVILSPNAKNDGLIGIAEKAIERSLVEVRLGNVRSAAR